MILYKTNHSDPPLFQTKLPSAPRHLKTICLTKKPRPNKKGLSPKKSPKHMKGTQKNPPLFPQKNFTLRIPQTHINSSFLQKKFRFPKKKTEKSLKNSSNHLKKNHPFSKTFQGNSNPPRQKGPQFFLLNPVPSKN